MKKNIKKKGFTIIELLAVIVVLAIIALIATPVVLGVIERARKGSAVSSAYGYIDAVEKQIALATLSSINYEDKEDYAYDEIEVSLKGKIPTAGTYELENSKVKNAVFCINGYTVTYSNNIAQAGEKCNPDDLKYKGSVKLSSSFGSYTYPETGTVEVIENISGGNLSCSSSDEEVATCSIEGTTLTVSSGTKEGTATITVKSEGNSKYKEAQAVYVASTAKGILSYTANDYEGTYDGKAHGITVTSSGATIKYGETEGSYTSTSSPTYKDAGIYNVYYQVTKSGYKTVIGSKQVIIIPSAPTITASDSKTSGEWHNGNYTLSFNVLGDSSSVYYYYGTTENPSTRGSSISINTDTSSTTYYVKACITDTLCSNNSSYISKVDKTTPALSLRDSADNTDSSLIYSSSFGISGGATTCINQSNNNLNVSTPNSVGILGSNVITCTATSNSGLTTTITKNFVLYGHFKYGSGLLATNGAYASGTSIVVPPGGTQYGPYVPVFPGCYQIWYSGNNLNSNPTMYTSYDSSISKTWPIINQNYISANSNYFLNITTFSGLLETVINNNTSNTVTVDEIYIWYRGSSC